MFRSKNAPPSSPGGKANPVLDATDIRITRTAVIVPSARPLARGVVRMELDESSNNNDSSMTSSETLNPECGPAAPGCRLPAGGGWPASFLVCGPISSNQHPDLDFP